MPTASAELVSLRQANAAYHDDYPRRLAAEIVAMLPDREEAKRVLAIADAIMNLELPGRSGKGRDHSRP